MGKKSGLGTGFNPSRILRLKIKRWMGKQVDLKWHELNSSQGKKDKNLQTGMCVHPQDLTIQITGAFWGSVGIISVMVNFMC